MIQAGYGWVETDEDGRFRFDLLPPGPYRLEVRRAVGLESREFDLEVGSSVVREFALRPPRRIFVRLEGLSAEARGISLRWVWSRHESTMRAWGEATVDARGEIAVDAPEPGTWNLEVQRSPFSPSLRASDLAVTGDSPREVRLQVPPGAALEGTLVDSDGHAVPDMGLTSSSDVSVNTDKSGNFALEWHPAGPTQFWMRWKRGSTHVGSADVPTTGRGRASLRVPGTASLAFRVVHSGDVTSGVASLSVEGFPAGPAQHQAHPDAHGAYVVQDVAAGTYRLHVWPGQGRPLSREIHLEDGEAKDLGDLSFEEPVDVPVELVVPAGGSLDGPRRVVAGVFAGETGGEISTSVDPMLVVDADGRAWLRGLAPGRYYLQIRIEGYAPIEREYSVSRIRPELLRLEFRKQP
jgi:hypothetical protein